MLSSGDSIWYLAKLLAAMSKTKDLIQTPVPDFSFVFGDRNLPVPTQWLTRTRAYPGPGRASAEGVPELGCYVGGAFKTRSHFGSERRRTVAFVAQVFQDLVACIWTTRSCRF
jgi:hypothetical protein